MTVILRFPTERTKPSRGNLQSGSGDVVIFPGVRIERGDFHLSDRLYTLRRAKSAVPTAAMRIDD